MIGCKDEEIEKRLKGILEKRYGLIQWDVYEKILNEELLGRKWEMSPRDLVYLFFDIEKEFNITIPEKDVIEDKFSTFNNIIDIIKNQLTDRIAEHA